MNANPMTEQVDRLIANRLGAGCELFLPGVGSLYVERRAAERLDDGRVVPPSRTVGFTSQERGVSLVDEIASAAHCEQEKAQSIYDRWLETVLGERTLVIGGVGKLVGDRFDPDPEFDRMLNPQGHAPVKIRTKRHDCTLWIALLAIVAALAIAYFALFARRAEHPESVRRATTSVAAEQPAPTDSTAVAAAGPAAGEAAASEPGASGVSAQPAAGQPAAGQNSAAANGSQGTAQSPARLVSGRHYVVYGVYSTPENAARAVAEVRAADKTLTCRVYYFGSKLMVSPYESDDLAACRRFMRAHIGEWPDVWPYTGR